MALRVGLVGYGYAGRTFHAPLVAAVPALQLAAVASSDAAKVQADWPGMPVHADPLALVARADIDLVVVATPNDSHHPLAAAALRAGKHVIVDKPFTVTLAQARELDELARRLGRVLSVFHNRRRDADFLTVQRLLREGALGRVVEMESRFDRFRPEVKARWREGAGPGSGLWYDLGPHLLDQALRLFGPPQGIALDRAALRDGALADDWFRATLRYERLRVLLHAGTLVASGPRFVLHGTRGSFVKEGLDAQEDALKAGARPGWPPAPAWGRDPGRATLARPGGEDAPVVLEAGDYAGYYAAVAAAIRGDGANPVPAGEAIEVMALIEAGIESDRARREVSPAL
jgi:predicted dehydrogenase